MATYISTDLSKYLTSEQTSRFDSLNDDQKQFFISDFSAQRRDYIIMQVLAVFFPIQMFFLNKVGLGIAFFLTAYGCGIWYIVEIFLTKGRVYQYNQEKADEILAAAEKLSK
jgi:hypothetical protein